MSTGYYAMPVKPSCKILDHRFAAEAEAVDEYDATDPDNFDLAKFRWKIKVEFWYELHTFTGVIKAKEEIPAYKFNCRCTKAELRDKVLEELEEIRQLKEVRLSKDWDNPESENAAVSFASP